MEQSKKAKNPRVLVTYAWVRSSWAIIRNLARHGLEVHAGDHQRVFMSRFSRYTKKWFRYPHYSEDPEGFIHFLIKYIEQNDIGTYIPSHEEGFIVAKYRDGFPGSVRIPISNYTTIDQLNNKILSQRLARKLEIPTPETFEIRTPGDLVDRLGRLPDKGVIKIPYSHGSHGVWFFESHDEVVKSWNKAFNAFSNENYPPFVQAFVTGKIYTTTVLAKDGRIHASFSRRNIREKESFGGACVKCTSIRFPPGLESAQKVVSHLQYTGVAMFEFLVDEATGSYWLMEVNPRYWGTTSHDIDCGIEYPFLQYCLANNIELPEIPHYREGLTSRWIAGDVISYFNNRAAHPTNYRIKRHLDFDDDFFMDFKVDDPIPFFIQSYLYFRHRKKIFSKK